MINEEAPTYQNLLDFIPHFIEEEIDIRVFRNPKKNFRTDDELTRILKLIKKYNVIPECYKKAEYFINLASNSLSIFENSDEKHILQNLTSFSLGRNF